MSALEWVRRALPGLWLGALIGVAALAAPIAFAVLERPEASRYVNALFEREAYASLLMGTVLLVLERLRARSLVSQGQGSQFSTGMVLALGAVFCTVLGYFAVQPLLPGARLGQGAMTFAQLHAVSVAFFGIKAVLAGVLAWQALKPVQAPANG